MSALANATGATGPLPLAGETVGDFARHAPMLPVVRPTRLRAIAQAAEDAGLLVLAVFAVPAIILLVGSPIALILRFLVAIGRRLIG
jgi:hypothetical protein